MLRDPRYGTHIVQIEPSTKAPSQAERVIAKFGSMTRLSRALGHENPTTVQRWKESGLIPMRQVQNVLAAAERCEIDLKEEDFFPAVGRQA